MFGFWRRGTVDIVGRLRPDLSRESLGVGPEFPGIVPNPLLSPAAMKRGRALRAGTLAIGTVVDWREVSSDGSPRVALMLDVETLAGDAFRGVADETLTVTSLARLEPGQVVPVRYRPAIFDHYVALARDVGEAEARELAARIAGGRTA